MHLCSAQNGQCLMFNLGADGMDFAKMDVKSSSVLYLVKREEYCFRVILNQHNSMIRCASCSGKVLNGNQQKQHRYTSSKRQDSTGSTASSRMGTHRSR